MRGRDGEPRSASAGLGARASERASSPSGSRASEYGMRARTPHIQFPVKANALPSHRPSYLVQMVAAPPPRASSSSSSAGAAVHGRACAARLARRTRPEWPAPPIPTPEAMASGRVCMACVGKVCSEQSVQVAKSGRTREWRSASRCACRRACAHARKRAQTRAPRRTPERRGGRTGPAERGVEGGRDKNPKLCFQTLCFQMKKTCK